MMNYIKAAKIIRHVLSFYFFRKIEFIIKELNFAANVRNLVCQKCVNYSKNIQI